MAYKLSCVLQGHEMDVRGVCRSVYPPGGLISVSRDRTIRVWKIDEDTGEFIEGQCFSGHQGFVAAVCTMPATEKHPHGLIVTGGHDNRILVWTIDSLEPIQNLSGHEGAVCALAAGNYGTLLSGSWDKTAKVWLGEKCMMTLKGHEQAVWAVALIKEQGMMLTASADKTIKLWKAGVCVQTFLGHTDCVRSLAILSPHEFLSSANDNTIRKWSISGECLRIYEGHTNFVYSVEVFSNSEEDFVSTSEDRSLKIWKDGKCTQTITLPAHSVWCAACLENNDIAVGSSDGVVRLFTCDPERMASGDVLKNFEEEVASHGIPAQVSSDGKLGDINIEDLPGPEALLRPGKSSGQNLLIKRGKAIEAHQWNDIEGKWEKIGEVVGAGGTSDEPTQNSGKTIYQGKEYDFVFNVDIEEGKPPLKLPYNLTDDPWLAAQQFLEKNNLSQLFLDQVADFIIKNSKSVTIGAEVQNQGYTDPFTGSGRYIPGSAPSNDSTNVNPGAGADPFTGQGSYQPSYSSPMSIETSPTTNNSTSNPCAYFPEKSYLRFDQVKVEGLIGRLKELNANVDENQKLENEDIAEIQNVLLACIDKNNPPKSPLTEKQLNTISVLLSWPADICYPGLDILRVLIRKTETSKHFIDNGEETIKHLMNITRSEKLTNQDITIGIVFRIFSNFFTHGKGANVMLEQKNLILQCIKDNCKNQNKIVQIAMSTVLINFAVAVKSQDDYETKVLCLDTLSLVMQHTVENEARFRSLVALGTLIWGDQDSVSYAKILGFAELVKPFSSSSLDKVKECALRLTNALR